MATKINFTNEINQMMIRYVVKNNFRIKDEYNKIADIGHLIFFVDNDNIFITKTTTNENKYVLYRLIDFTINDDKPKIIKSEFIKIIDDKDIEMGIKSIFTRIKAIVYSNKTIRISHLLELD